MSSKLFRQFPFEIVQIILEFAATSQVTAARLSCVSTQVFSIVVPILYHTVKVSCPDEEMSALAIALSAPIRGRYYQSLIRNLFLGPQWQFRSLDIRFCNNLRHISIPHSVALSISSLARNIPSLTHLTLHREPLTQIIHSKLFTHLTHIFATREILDVYTLTLNLSDVILPNLTHLIAPLLTNDVPSNNSVLRRFFRGLSRQPKLKYVGLGLFWFDGTSDQADPSMNISSLLESVDAELQASVFVFPLHLYHNGSWERWMDKDAEVWRLAEDLAKRRE
jgi:hypothetical protein